MQKYNPVQHLKFRVQYKAKLHFQLTGIQSSVHSNSEFDSAIWSCKVWLFHHIIDYYHQNNVSHDLLLTMQP
jgi:hypothetical protein